MLYHLYMIPEIGILDNQSSTPNLGNNTLPLYVPEIGILDWLSSTPIWEMIHYLYMTAEIGYLVTQLWKIVYYLYMTPKLGY